MKDREVAQKECGGIRWIRHNVYNQGKYAVTIATSQSNQLSSESEVKKQDGCWIVGQIIFIGLVLEIIKNTTFILSCLSK